VILANGITPLSATYLLIADSIAGSVILLNTNTGISSTLLSEPEMLPVEGTTVSIGINGVKLYPSFSCAPLHGGKRYLYFTNSFHMTLYRIPISASTGAKLGAVEKSLMGVSWMILPFVRLMGRSLSRLMAEIVL
jgi:hypothetical protein